MNATVREIMIAREQPAVGEVALHFAQAAETLAVASRSWGVLPPTSRAELDAISNQTEGLRIALAQMRSAMQK